MSQENFRQYQRDKASLNPFKKPPHPHKNQKSDQGPSGSDWGLPQIEWLGIKWEWSCEISQMLSLESELQSDSQLQRSIFEALNMPWITITTSKTLDANSLYAMLARLAQIDKPLAEYDKSSTIEGPSSQPTSQGRDPFSPFSSPQQGQEPNTPIQHIRSRPPSMPASLTPRPKRQSQFTFPDHNPRSPFSSPPSSPPAMIESPTPFRRQWQSFQPTSASLPESHTKETSEVQEIVDDQDEGRKDGGVQGGSGLWSDSDVPQVLSNNDSEEEIDDDTQAKGKSKPILPLPSTSATGRRSTFRRNKNPVNDVLEDPLTDIESNSKSRSSSEDLDYYPSSSHAPLETPSSGVHGISKAQLEAEPKSEEEVKFAARKFLNVLINLFNDRCQDRQTDSGGNWDLDLINRIEYREFLDRKIAKCVFSSSVNLYGITSLLTESSVKRSQRCSPKYSDLEIIIVSIDTRRMDVTDAYLAQLHDTSDLPNHEPPHVRQSRKFDLRDDSERVEIGQISTRIVIEMLAKYNQPKKLGIIRHLKS